MYFPHGLGGSAGQNLADPFGYVSWLLTVQMLKNLLTKGLISSEDARKMIERAAELAYLNSFAIPEDVEAVLAVTCDLLELPHDAFKSKESEDISSDD